MDKQTFTWILEIALLYNEGMEEARLIELCDNPKLVKLGVVLCNYLHKIDYSAYQSFQNKEISILVERIGCLK